MYWTLLFNRPTSCLIKPWNTNIQVSTYPTINLTAFLGVSSQEVLWHFAVWVKSFPRRALGGLRPERAEESCLLTADSRYDMLAFVGNVFSRRIHICIPHEKTFPTNTNKANLPLAVSKQLSSARRVPRKAVYLHVDCKVLIVFWIPENPITWVQFRFESIT